MRVALHADQLAFAAPGGIATYVRNLGPALAAAGAEVVPFHARLDDWRDEPWMAGMEVVALPRSIRTLYPSWDLLGRPRLALPEVDVVHATNHVAVPPAAPRRALVVTVHDLAFLRSPELFPPRWRMLYRAGLRAAARRADLVITPSRATADDLLDRTGIDDARVRVTPLAAALPHGTGRASVALPERYVLSVGTLEPRKNLARLVRAYRRAAASGLDHALVLAGPRGWRSGELDRELAAGGAGDIVVLGALGADDLDAAYRGASAFAYPSLLEGFGLPVLEAMARGVPVVASTDRAIGEVGGGAILAVDPLDENAIADALLAVVSDRTLAARLAREGRERAAGFTWEATAAATLAAYREVAP